MNQPMIKLRDGNMMPQLGYGVWQVADDVAQSTVATALEVGYRSIDTAAIYKNEVGVGKALRSSGVKREDIFLTTKLWNDDQGYDSAFKAFNGSLDRMGVDYVDLYLIHWPSPFRKSYAETWKALIKIQESGRVKSIGVSNFCEEHLQKIIDETSVVPVLNQVELHPRFQQKNLRNFHAKFDIKTECWSPLGQGKILQDSALQAIAAKYEKSVAQVILKWHLQNGFIVIPKSENTVRIKENFDVFNFDLSGVDMEVIAGLDDKNGKIGPDPMTAEF